MGKVFQPINQLREVQLKKSGESHFQTFAASEVQSYRHKGNLYEAHEIQKGEGDVFLVVILKGAANLYTTSHDGAFYLEKDSAFYALAQKNRIVEGKFLEDRRFEGILRVVFNDCPLPSEAFAKVKLSERSLTELTKQYNLCREPETIYETERKPIRPIKFGVLAGPTLNRGTLINYLDHDLQYHKNKLSFAVGFEMLMNSAIVPNLYLRPSIGITRKQVGLTQTFSLDYVERTTDYTSLQAPVRLSYFIPGKTISPYFTGGVIFSIPLRTEVNVWQTRISTGEEVYRERYKLNKPYELGALAGAGLQLQTLEKLQPFLEYHYDKTWITRGGGWNFLTHNLMLGIRF